MRATGQTECLTGVLNEEERRLVASKAILGEWIGGSGGGWQDSGGVWPGIKKIEGVKSEAGDPEFGISKGRLLPQHTILKSDLVSSEIRKKLQESLVIVYGESLQQKPLNKLLEEHGFNHGQHEQIRKDLKSGKIGLSKNRLPVNTTINDINQLSKSYSDRHLYFSTSKSKHQSTFLYIIWPCHWVEVDSHRT